MDDLTKMVSISMDTGAVKKMANAEHFLGYAEKIIVTNDHDYEQAADLIGDIASRIKKFDAVMTMHRDDKPGLFTRVTTLSAKFDLAIPKYIFTRSNLQNPRN